MTTTPIEDRPAETSRQGSIPADTLAARLMLARMHAGNLSIREAAERCSLNYGTWGNWERGDEPRRLLNVVERISEGLGVDRDWLLYGGPLTGADENQRRWTGRSPGLTSPRYIRLMATSFPRATRDHPPGDALLTAA